MPHSPGEPGAVLSSTFKPSDGSASNRDRIRLGAESADFRSADESAWNALDKHEKKLDVCGTEKLCSIDWHFERYLSSARFVMLLYENRIKLDTHPSMSILLRQNFNEVRGPFLQGSRFWR